MNNQTRTKNKNKTTHTNIPKDKAKKKQPKNIQRDDLLQEGRLILNQVKTQSERFKGTFSISCLSFFFFPFPLL